MSYELTTRTWMSVLRHATGANEVCPRGMKTRELLHNQTFWEMDYPMILLAERRLNLRFMFAEAFWILSGSNQLSFLTPYCEEIAKFSDDGETLAGAYGSPLMRQWNEVFIELAKSQETRQAVITLWQPIFGSNDVPCTVSLQFLIRNGRLDLAVFMRSSDIWLGLPYDVFAFSMIAWRMLLQLNSYTSGNIQIGRLALTTGSQHLYERDRVRADECLRAKVDFDRIGKMRALSQYGLNTPDDLMAWLKSRRDTPGIEL